MTLIREDSIGLFIKTNGSCYRLIFPVGYQHVYKDGSHYKKDIKVGANAISGAELARVGEETWFCHGHYISSSSPF